jgi:hypothetical protein
MSRCYWLGCVLILVFLDGSAETKSLDARHNWYRCWGRRKDNIVGTFISRLAGLVPVGPLPRAIPVLELEPKHVHCDILA